MLDELKFVSGSLLNKIHNISYPNKLIYNVTNYCNLNCKICNISKKKRVDELTLDQINSFFTQNNKFLWIDVTGGEIFLRKDIDDIFKIIIRNCKNLVYLHFPTNGFLTEKILYSVSKIKSKFNKKLVITVSIDGTKNIHDSIRGVEGSWNNAINTFKKLYSQYKNDVYIGYTISKYNEGSLKETFIELKKQIPYLKLEIIQLNVAQYSKSYYDNSIDVVPVNKYIDDINFKLNNRFNIFSSQSIVEHIYLNKMVKFFKEQKYPLKKCSSLNSTITMYPNGDIFPCLFFDKNLGNIKNFNYDLNKLMNSTEVKILRKNILNKCDNCWSACEATPSILNNYFRIK